MLRISGVTLEFEGDCSALGRRAPRVLTFNHASTLDLFIITAILTPGGTAVVKRSILYIPFMGWSAYLAGLVLLDRSNRERAIASIEKAGARIRDESLSVFIAPEGTRTSSRAPAKFKRGAFRMAEVARADIVPVVIDGAAEVWPRDKNFCWGGTVKIRVLQAIPHAELMERGARAVADDLRERYARDLGVELPVVETRELEPVAALRYPGIRLIFDRYETYNDAPKSPHSAQRTARIRCISRGRGAH